MNDFEDSRQFASRLDRWTFRAIRRADGYVRLGVVSRREYPEVESAKLAVRSKLGNDWSVELCA